MKRVSILVSFTVCILVVSSAVWANDEKALGVGGSGDKTVTIGGKRDSIVLTESTGSAAGELEGPISSFKLEKRYETEEELFTMIVRKAYRALGEYTRAGGRDIGFKLSGFQTLTADQFDEIYFTDIATPPTGKTIDMERKTTTDEINGIKSVEYTPRWELADNEWADTSQWLRLLAMNVQEMLREEGKNDQDVLNAYAVTPFEVKVTFEGDARRYKAAFLWIRGDTKGSWRFRVLDWITRGVDRAITETIPIDGIPIPMTPREKIFHETCYAETDLDGITSSWHTGTNDHLSGYHEAYAEFLFYCTCDTSCQSRCIGSLGYHVCGESLFTVTNFFHVFKDDIGEGLTIKNNAVISGAQCAAAFPCAQRSCLTPFCSLSVSVTVVGISVQVSYSSNDWSRTLNASDTCFACEVVPPSSPILVNMRGSFELTGLDESVLFDIDGDGELNSISWTDAAGDDAFLVLDRNSNGNIDDGTELFGSVTPQPPAEGEPNGFNALSVYDRPQNGGNSDGLIDEADWVYDELRLWLDGNHDAVSQSDEMTTLAAAGITAIELDYVVSRRLDRHGNKFTWQGKVRTAQGKKRPAADVIFLIQRYEP